MSKERQDKRHQRHSQPVGAIPVVRQSGIGVATTLRVGQAFATEEDGKAKGRDRRAE
jgi:hypothetical protein